MKRTKGAHKRDEILRESVRANVVASVDNLRHASRFLEKMVISHELMIVGAEYDIDTGLVDFFELPTPRAKRSKRS